MGWVEGGGVNYEWIVPLRQEQSRSKQVTWMSSAVVRVFTFELFISLIFEKVHDKVKALAGTAAELRTITATQRKYPVHNLGTFSEENVPFTSFSFHSFTFLWCGCCDAMVDFKLHSGSGYAVILLYLFFWYFGLQRNFYSMIKIWLLPRETDTITAFWLNHITRWNLWPHFVSPHKLHYSILYKAHLKAWYFFEHGEQTC